MGLGLPVGPLSPSFGLRFLLKQPNTEKGFLFMPWLLGILGDLASWREFRNGIIGIS